MAHAGMLALDGEERPIRAQIELTLSELLVAVHSGPLGAWPLASCRIEPDGDRFLIDVDGDVAWFNPDDPSAFARELLQHDSQSGLASAVKTARVASSIAPWTAGVPAVNTESPLAEEAEVEGKGSWWLSLSDGQKNLALAAGAIIAGAIVVATLAGGSPTDSTVASTIATTASAPEAAVGLDLGELSMRWNDVAAALRTQAFIPGVPEGNRMEVDLGRGIVLYATEDPASQRVRTLMISAGPGEGEQAEAVLAAWGTLIATVNPELSPAGRRAVLDRLGVDVARPLQLGLKTETEEGSASYWFRSGVLGGRALLGVELDPNPPE